MEGRSAGCLGPPAELLHSLAREPQLWGYLLSPSQGRWQTEQPKLWGYPDPFLPFPDPAG